MSQTKYPKALDRLSELQAFTMKDHNGVRFHSMTPEQVIALLDQFTTQDWHAMANGLFYAETAERARATK